MEEQLFPEEIEKRPVDIKETTWTSVNVEIPSSTLNVYVRDCMIEVTSGFDQELFRRSGGGAKTCGLI